MSSNVDAAAVRAAFRALPGLALADSVSNSSPEGAPEADQEAVAAALRCVLGLQAYGVTAESLAARLEADHVREQSNNSSERDGQQMMTSDGKKRVGAAEIEACERVLRAELAGSDMQKKNSGKKRSAADAPGAAASGPTFDHKNVSSIMGMYSKYSKKAAENVSSIDFREKGSFGEAEDTAAHTQQGESPLKRAKIEDSDGGGAFPAAAVNVKQEPMPTPTKVQSQLPTSQVKLERMSPASAAQTYAQARAETSGQVVFSHNPELSLAGGVSAPFRRHAAEVALADNVVSSAFRYMNDRLATRFEALESRLEALSDATAEEHGLAMSRVFHVECQDTVDACGRVCCEVEGRLNAASVVLEGATRHVKARVRLLLKDVESGFSVFPGQIIGVRGTNPTGRLFMAEALFTPPPLPLRQRKRPLERPLSVVCAAGPWTTATKSWDFSPVTDFLKNLAKMPEDNRPSLVIMVGPFVDVNHPYPGSLTVTFEDAFNRACLNIIERQAAQMFKDWGTRTVVIPSLRDAHHAFVFPQPPFARRGNQARVKSDGSEPLILAGNPATIIANDVSIGVSSVDVLKNLSQELVQEGKVFTGDMLGSLSRHVVQQRSYYPLYPPTATDSSAPARAPAPTGGSAADKDANVLPAHNFANDVPLDVSHLSAVEFPGYTPDILILPSVLAPFARAVPTTTASGQPATTLVVNPGQATKFQFAGTYAKLTVHEGAEDRIVADHTRVDVVKL